MDKVPAGWVKRPSGLVVPRPKRRMRRRPILGGLVLATILLAPNVADGVSAVSRAAIDVVTLVRTVLVEADDGDTTTPAKPGCP